MTARIQRIAIFIVLVLALTINSAPAGNPQRQAGKILNETGVKGGLIVHIGCGDGRVLRLASKRYGARAIGYEVNLLAYIKARLLCLGDNNIQIKCKNFWKENLAGADVVFCYLYPDLMQRLSDKLRCDLKPGTVVASCNFALPGFQSQKVLRPGGALHNDPVYIYQV